MSDSLRRNDLTGEGSRREPNNVLWRSCATHESCLECASDAERTDSSSKEVSDETRLSNACT
jgi:hypothetical protein